MVPPLEKIKSQSPSVPGSFGQGSRGDSRGEPELPGCLVPGASVVATRVQRLWTLLLDSHDSLTGGGSARYMVRLRGPEAEGPGGELADVGP